MFYSGTVILFLRPRPLNVSHVGFVFQKLNMFLSCLRHWNCVKPWMAVQTVYLGKSDPTTRSFPPGIELGTLEHKAVTLANKPQREVQC